MNNKGKDEERQYLLYSNSTDTAATTSSNGSSGTTTTELRLPVLGPRPHGPGGLYRQNSFRFRHHRRKAGGILENAIAFFRWMLIGYSSPTENNSNNYQQSDDDEEEVLYNLECVARILVLLREYEDRHGMPKSGGPQDQEYVIREIMKDLYAGGAPLWALETGMKLAAEGMTGKAGIDFLLLPRKAFIIAPTSGATSMFQYARGFDMQRLKAAEAVMVRMALFRPANSNTATTLQSSTTRMPSPAEFFKAYTSTTGINSDDDLATKISTEKDDMVKEILELASASKGLFYHIQRVQNNQSHDCINDIDGATTNYVDPECNTNSTIMDIDAFWTVEDTILELFQRLVTNEAMASIHKADADRSKKLYPSWILLLFRFLSSAGACAFWFNGSWADIVAGGCCGVVVGLIAQLNLHTREERIIVEALASFVVGAIAGGITLFWADTCFNAIALAGVQDILQGFRVVYAIIEIMSKNTLSGCADFFEGLLFTVIVSAFLHYGKGAVMSSVNTPDVEGSCDNKINELWYFFWVPAASLSWCGLFNPEYYDLFWMTFHGVLGFATSYRLDQTNMGAESKLFLAALIVTFSSGVVSRFSGRQAIGNAIAGLYVLLPGSYLVSNVSENSGLDWITSVFFRAGAIGLGAWTGTLLCSPTIFGSNKGFLQNKLTRVSTRQVSALQASVHREHSIRKSGTGAMLFF